ncbi:MAG: hypothetical protein R2845_11115 [Thermomicrobiales bacterium]
MKRAQVLCGLTFGVSVVLFALIDVLPISLILLFISGSARCRIPGDQSNLDAIARRP